MPEFFAENEATRHLGGEVRPGESTEEKISLSDRFGLVLTFYPFNQDDYLAIVAGWVAALGGQITAFSFIGIGVLLSLTGNFVNGLWLVFIGWFLQNAASNSIAQADLRKTLAGVTAGQVMSRTLVRVPSQTPVGSLVETESLGAGQRAFFVSDDERVRGMVTLTDIARLPRPAWETTPVERIMAPAERWVRIDPDTELLAAIETMETANVKQLPVMAEGRIIGLLSREQALTFLRLRAEVPA